MACWQHRYNLVVVVTSGDPTVWRCRWQREIDFNALNGVNLPLAFTGQGGGGVRQLVCAWWQVVSRVDLLCVAALVVGSHELEYIWSQGRLCWRCLSGWLVVWSLTRRTRSSVQVIRVDGARSRATLCWTSLSGVGVSPLLFLPPRSCTVLSSCMLCRVAWATFARGVGLCKLYVVVAWYSRAYNKASCAVPIISLDGCSLTRAPCGSGSGMPRQLCRSKSSSGKLNSACKVCCRVLLATCLRYNLRSPRLRACTPCHHVFGCYARRSRRRSRTPTSRVARCGTPSRSSTEVTICWSRLTQRSRRSAPN